MTSFDRFERSLPALIDELAAPRTPDYLDDILARTAATRQRPGWTFPERWLPMSALTGRLAAAPRIPWRVAGALALLILALVVGLLIAGGRQAKIPAPFGPAANGGIAFADKEGAIHVGDPATGTDRIVVPGAGHERPFFSPDGQRIAFLESSSVVARDLVVVDLDGAHRTVVASGLSPSVGYLGWTPSAKALVAGVPGVGLEAFDLGGNGKPRVISKFVTDPGDFNNQLSGVFQPPDGRQIVYVGVSPAGGQTISVAAVDGSAEKILLDGSHPGIAFTELSSAQWSPDGKKIAFKALLRDYDNDYRVFVMNADGSDLHPLTRSTATISEANPAWSPDGTRIAMQRWNITGTGSSAAMDTRAITIVDVATGADREVGAISGNGYVGWGWSPDGKSILELPGDGISPLLIVNADNGVMLTMAWDIASAGSWQRIAR